MMWRKGAFYVGDPDVGNGCLDFHQPGGEGKGGCPFISCLKCNYVVVRLQGAAWNDHDGTVDLYLTTRNYYPDWSRLASTHPVGVPKAKTLGYALVANQNAAAYCCQCSWLTVKGEKETIETKMAEAVMAKSLDNNIFCSTLPNEGSTLRPPLWVCRGHFA
ncbi:hypothetical protein AGDE_05575 [Angomonas deanei]|uniref:Cilia- and flagella-associated protein 418 n=1 Tax=Angomonas deanei TaxID=59799 RepID=A0A7G2CA63_9TRYP|nr:hypothetical protein AGDE_05575 [Angomonas deanei]CAD2214902.1 hypothetical protein, conserved [Angomonas deanei]|eukprot:EPY38354.1 hypothetical protein AGDE_05575 [Angomonas deanei]